MFAKLSAENKYRTGVFFMCFGFVHFFRATWKHYDLFGFTHWWLFALSAGVYLGLFLLGVRAYNELRQELIEAYEKRQRPFTTYLGCRFCFRTTLSVIAIFTVSGTVFLGLEWLIPWGLVLLTCGWVWFINGVRYEANPSKPEMWFRLY